MGTDAKRPSEVLAGQVKYWRERRHLTAQQLADRVSDIGGKLDRVAIAKIETNSRGVSLDETVQLAYALTVPPPLLFLPLGSEDAVAIVPNVVIHPHLAWKWVVGEEGPATSDRLGIRLDESYDALLRVREHERLWAAQEAMQGAGTDLRMAERSGNPERMQRAKEAHADALGGLAHALDSMI